MSYFKRFTDFCAGFAVFGALLHLIRNFVTFMKGEEISTLEKVKEFFSRANTDDYRAYATVALVLGVSLALGIAFSKFSFVALTLSSISMAVIIDLLEAQRIDERPMFYVILAAIHVIGCIFECIMCDRARVFKKLNCTLTAGILTTFAGGALSLFTAYRLSEMKELFKNSDVKTFDITKLSSFDAQLFNLVKDASAKSNTTESTQLIILAVMFIVVIIVTMLIGEIFFIDLTFSAIPLITVAYCYTSGIFLPQADMLVTIALISTVTFFAATLFGTRHEKPQPEVLTEPASEDNADTADTADQIAEGTEI